MPGFLKRALAISAGIALGCVLAVGSGLLHSRAPKADEPPPVQRERAPDTRV